jgi:hypothetical protein
MDQSKMRTGLKRYSLCAVLGAVACMACASVSVADDKLAAGDVSGSPGQTAAVPITIKLGGDNVAFFGATFTVTPQGSAPAVAEKLTYQAAKGTPPPDLQTAVQAAAKLAIGYGAVTIKPPLTGTVRVGTLMVPIPAGASGIYQVGVLKVSAGDSSGKRLTITGQAGKITVGGGAGSK